MEGTFEDYIVQPSYHGQGQLPPDQNVQSPIQPDLEHFQGLNPFVIIK